MKRQFPAKTLILFLCGFFCFFQIAIVFAAPGDLDTTFNGTGKSRAGLGGGSDQGNAVAQQTDGKLVVAGSSYNLPNIDFSVVRYNPNGSLDTSFGNVGKVLTPIGAGDDVATAVKIQADGKIVVAGYSYNGSNSDFAVVRYNTDGTLDGSFDGDGKVITDISAADRASALVIQSDGKIGVGGGVTLSSSGSDFAIVRYNTDGSLDPLFGLNGVVTTDFGVGGSETCNAVTLQADGKIVAAGGGAYGTPYPIYFAAIARYNSDGSLDTSFNAGLEGHINSYNSVAIQPGNGATSDKIVVAGYAGSYSPVLTIGVARYNLDGTKDTTFEGDGEVTTAVGLDSSVGFAVAVQGTGVQVKKIIVAGYTSNSGGQNLDFTVLRYNANGTLDTSFDGDGIAITPLSPRNDIAKAVLLQPSKVVVAGYGEITANNIDFAIVRYNLTDGSLDTTFDGDGKRTDDVGNTIATAKAVAIQTNGKIDVAGSTSNGYFGVMRYNADGTLDTSFDGDGKTATAISNGSDTANALAIQSDGKIIVAGYANGNFGLVRFNIDGSLDTSFDGDGQVTTDIAGAANAVAIQADGKIVVAGKSYNGSNFDFAVARYNVNGSLDTSFDGDGKVITPIGTGNDVANGIAIQPDGKIVVAGYSSNGTNDDFAIVRYNSDGSLDSLFDGDGKQTTPIGPGNDQGNALGIQTNGKIIVAGVAHILTTDDFAVVRYNTDGTLDTSFHGNGKTTTAVGAGNDSGNALAIQMDGKIVVAGSSFNGTNDDFALVRYNSNGSPDTSYGSGGKVTVDISGDDIGYGLALDSIGRAVVVGESGSLFGVVRLAGDPPSGSFTIGGHITYDDTTPAGKPGKNMTMTLTGPAGFTPVQTTTDNNGNYSFSNVPAGSNHTVTPSRTAEGHDPSITAFDASLAARFAANPGVFPLSPNQQVAGDTSNNGSVTAFDASQIARYQARIVAPGSIAGSWKFTPASLTFNNLSADRTDGNLTAILVGDVTGNWAPAGPTKVGPLSTAATITVSLPNKQDPPGGPSTIPITVGDMTGRGVFAYSFDLTFNQSVLQPQSTPFDTNGTLSGGLSVTANSSTPGHLVINVFSSSNEISGQGILLNLKFNVIGAPPATTPLTWAGFDFNEGDPADNSINGQFTVGGPTAAPARISGQIINAEGQPVSGATITVTGTPKLIRAITNSNGFYKVENLETSGFYTVTPSRANYVFAPANRSFSLVADNTEALFTGMAIDPDANPLDSPEFFVRQQYLDFLGREPDQDGLDYWSAQLRACDSHQDCLDTRRTEVSAAFFIAQEFQDSGLFIYDVYQAALGRRPLYAEYSADRKEVVGGPTLETKKTAFAASFVARAEFIQQYPLTMTADVFVDALLRRAQQTSGIDLSSERDRLISLYNSSMNANESRSLVLRSVAEGSNFKQAQYNSAFVLMEYFGYLGRNADDRGYQFWLNILNTDVTNDTSAYRTMVCAFVTSMEYQKRFSAVVTHSNQECGP